MKHPTRETWMSYLYNELSASARSEAAAHLAGCAECQSDLAGWRATVSALDAWTLPRHGQRAPRFPWLVAQWAAAAAVVLAVGIGIGRLSASGPDLEQLRATLEPSLREQVRSELAEAVRAEMAQASVDTLDTARADTRNLLAGFASRLEQQRGQDWQTIRTALTSLQQERLTDRRDLETVAVLTGAGLRQTQQQLAQLADYPSATPNPF